MVYLIHSEFAKWACSFAVGYQGVELLMDTPWHTDANVHVSSLHVHSATHQNGHDLRAKLLAMGSTQKGFKIPFWLKIQLVNGGELSTSDYNYQPLRYSGHAE